MERMSKAEIDRKFLDLYLQLQGAVNEASPHYVRVPGIVSREDDVPAGTAGVWLDREDWDRIHAACRAVGDFAGEVVRAEFSREGQ